MKYLVMAQLQPRNTVRALVLGIGQHPWPFSPARAACRCRKAFPDLSDIEHEALVRELQSLANAAIEPIQSMLGSAEAKRRPAASQVKAKLRRQTLTVEGGLEPGFLARFHK